MRRSARRLRGTAGFAMPLVLGVLVVATLLGLAALSAASGETPLSGESRDRKQAYAAAEAGANWYQSRLIFDNAFWSKCATVAGPSAPVSNPWNGAGADPRLWRSIPGSKADYSVELLPANGAAACSVDNPGATLVDTASGTFRIRSTGRYNGAKRSTITTFRRARFLDFLYHTTYETTDPANYPVQGVSAAYAAANCAKKQRADRSGCSEIQFATGDSLRGPLHSDDSLQICGAPSFGRTNADAIETAAPAPGYVAGGGSCGAANPDFKGTFRAAQATVPMPATNAAVKTNALAANSFTGSTYVTLNGAANTITVKKMTSATTFSTPTTQPWPTNGLLYVGGTGSCTSLSPSSVPAYTGSSAESFGCANVYVHGTYTKDITIASDKDVIVDGDLTGVDGSNGVAGLIANNFVRVYHPVSSVPDSAGRCTGSTNGSGAVNGLEIDAAILAVSHSFTVDNNACGAPLGNLTVSGAIAQFYRGAVATSSGTTIASGYVKAYDYDDRFKYRNPPYFLSPVNATWRILRTSEQVPAR